MNSIDCLDTRGRPLKDLRLSVIDQCNFRCTYCMPKEVYGKDFPFLNAAQRLSFDQMAMLARAFVGLGVEKIRITGGEPLLRKDLPRLIETLAAMRTVSGQPLDIALTTNGSLLAAQAQSLKDAGLRRVTVSLDALDDDVFGAMNDVGFPVSRVLDGIAAAQRVGLAPVKVNTVVQRGVNDSQILPLARHFRHSGVQLRFIEYMDVGGAERWAASDVLDSDAMRAVVAREFPLRPQDGEQGSDTASVWRYADGGGSVGFISSMSHPFCGDCTRARVSAEGKLYLCLFARDGVDLKPLLRAGGDAALTDAVRSSWQRRGDRYSELRGTQPVNVGTGIAALAGARRHRIVRMSLVGG